MIMLIIWSVLRDKLKQNVYTTDTTVMSQINIRNFSTCSNGLSYISQCFVKCYYVIMNEFSLADFFCDYMTYKMNMDGVHNNSCRNLELLEGTTKNRT